MNQALKKIDYLFNPGSVAIIGASGEFGKWGFGIINRVLRGNGNFKVYPVNPKSKEILGVKAYKKVTDIPGDVDLAVVVIPPGAVPAVMEDCVSKGVRAVIVITAGFREVGGEGTALEAEILRIAGRGGIRVVGPNCMGHFSTSSGLFTTGGPGVQPGKLGLISQSGNFGGYIFGRGTEKGIGFSKFVSSGNEADLTIEDYIEYLGEDEDTGIICAYIEGLKDGRRFMETARKITRRKPIIVMKVGCTPEGASAAMSHTGSLSGADEIHDAAFHQAGVIRVNRVDDLLDVASALIRQPLPGGRRVGILTGGGGFGVVATDACRRMELEIPPLSEQTIGSLSKFMVSRWSHANPVDMAGDSYGSIPCCGTLLKADEVDAVLAVSCLGFVPQPADEVPSHLREKLTIHQKRMADGEVAAMDGLIERIDRYGKPLIIAAVSDRRQSGGIARLADNDIYTYSSPEAGARVLSYLVKYGEYLNGCRE